MSSMRTPVAIPRYGSRARLGILLPSGNAAAEPELAALMPEGVSLHTTRLKLNGSSEADLLNMADRIEDATALIHDTDPHLIGFHCTAVSTFNEELEQGIINRAGSIARTGVVTTGGAIVTALRRLQAHRVALVTPYIEPINRREIAFLERYGFQCVASRSAGLQTPAEMLAADPDRWLQDVREGCPDSADAVLVSCTAIRTLSVIDACEAACGRPVISSNNAMAWHMLRSAGLKDQMDGAGRLLSSY